MKTSRQKPTHSDLVNFAVDYLRSKGHWAWVNKTTGVWDPRKKIFRRNTTYRGAGDVIGVLKGGTHIEIEVKVGRDNLSEDQIRHRDFIERQGGIYIVMRDPEDLINDPEI